MYVYIYIYTYVYIHTYTYTRTYIILGHVIVCNIILYYDAL